MSKLVTREERSDEHFDGAWPCLRAMPFRTDRFICIDCGESGSFDKSGNHVCEKLPQESMKRVYRPRKRNG
jgi:hypothetical protein